MGLGMGLGYRSTSNFSKYIVFKYVTINALSQLSHRFLSIVRTIGQLLSIFITGELFNGQQSFWNKQHVIRGTQVNEFYRSILLVKYIQLKLQQYC